MTRFPADMIARLERWGHYEAYRRDEAAYRRAVDEVMVPFVDWGVRDFAGFCDELAALMATYQGGWATLGAARLVWEMTTNGRQQIAETPSALALALAGIRFKRERQLGLTFGEIGLGTQFHA